LNIVPYDQFVNYPIPKEQLHEPEEDKSIEEIRRIKKEEWKRKEEEAKVKNRIDRDTQEKAFEIVKKQKEYERKNVTTDLNGNVIFIKPVAIEKLSQDFINTKFDIKNKGEIANTMVLPKDYAKLGVPIKKDNTKSSDKAISSIKNKPIDTHPQLTTGSNIDKVEIPVVRVERNYERSAIVPAGSSFDLITPEIGVTILEGTKLKTGGTGKDFHKAFKKYSKYDYVNLVRDSEFSYSSTILKDNNDPERADFNISTKDPGQLNSLGMTSVNSNNNNLFTLSLPKITENPNKILTNTTGSIKLNTKYGTLKSALDGLDLIPEFDEIVSPDKIEKEDLNNSNLFKKTKMGKMEQSENNTEGYIRSLEEINKFNLSIVKNPAWGAGKSKINTDKYNNKTFYKPSRKDVEREVGKNVAETKLPRSRVFSFVSAPGSLNATATSGFNKTARDTNKFKNTFSKN
jgi:hypothetical protein